MSSRAAQLEADIARLNQAIQTRMSGRGHIEAFSAQGRTYQFTDLREMFELREYLESQLRGARGPRQVRVRLGRRNRR